MKMQEKTMWQKSRPWLIAFVVVAIYIWAFAGVGFSPIKEQAGTITKAIFAGLLNPDWSYIYNPEGEDLIQALIETIAIAFLGTFISAILSVPFGFLAARTSKKFQAHVTIGKLFLTVIRVFPEIVLALMFIKAVGPGAYAGVLAVSIHSIGMLGKLFSEAVENVDRRPEEAIISAGGTRAGALTLATFPTVLPEFLNYTLYRFEISVRAASILGIVGAGGIGTPLIFALQTRNWERVGIILVGIIIMVTLIDYISGAIRRRIV